MVVQVLNGTSTFRTPRWVQVLCLAWENHRARSRRIESIRMSLDLESVPEFRVSTWEDAHADERTTLHAMDRVGGAGMLLRLFNEAYIGAPDYRRAGWVQLAALQASHGFDPELVWIAFRDGTPVGFCMARVGDGRARITGLGVLPDHRRQGIGAMLLRHAVAEVYRRGARTVELTVCASNQGSINVYRRLGFRQI